MHKDDERTKTPSESTIFARVVAVTGLEKGCKTVSATLQTDRESKIHRAVLVGIEARRKGRGVIIRNEEGVRAHIFYDAKALRRLFEGALVQIDWSPVGDHLMANIAITVTAADRDKECSSEE